MKTNDIKKGMKIRTKQLGTPISGTMEDNLKGNTRLIKTNGSEIGMFDEYGSVYVWDIVEVEVDGIWERVELTDKQKKAEQKISNFWS